MRSAIQQVLSSTVQQAKKAVAPVRVNLTRSTEPEIDLSADAEWSEVDDLTDNFDQKLATFMDFEDAAASRQWMLND